MMFWSLQWHNWTKISAFTKPITNNVFILIDFLVTLQRTRNKCVCKTYIRRRQRFVH